MNSDPVFRAKVDAQSRERHSTPEYKAKFLERVRLGLEHRHFMRRLEEEGGGEGGGDD